MITIDKLTLFYQHHGLISVCNDGKFVEFDSEKKAHPAGTR